MSGVALTPIVRSQRSIDRRETLQRLARSKTFVAGALVVLFWIACAILGSRVTPDDPLAQNLLATLARPSWSHPFGTDQLGRDVLSRVLAGSRSILEIAPAATALAIAAGTTVGLVTGYFGGIIDDLLGRVVDAMLALPLIVLAITIIAALGPSTATLVVVVGTLFTPLVSRTVRAAVLAERRLDYVQAARLRGENPLHVMFVEILPNVTAPIVVEATVRLGYAIFTVAGLTFLGFGVQEPSPDWALQIADNYSLLAADSYWWTVLFPALAIASLVVAVNLMADGIGRVLER